MRHLSSVDWAALHEVMVRLPRNSLLAAALCAALSYASYCSFDLLGRCTTGHKLSTPRVLGIAFVNHACALSLGPVAAGVRFRLAMRHGLPVHLTAALWLFNVASNWLGFMLVAGVALVTRSISWPARWGIDHGAMQAAGAGLLAVAFAYVVACGVGRRLSWTVRGVEFRLPTLPVALLQCGVSALNWLLLAGVMHELLREQAPFTDVLSALMANALALAVIDVPAGIGITETVFLTLLGPQIPAMQTLAALMAYRALYFVGPLLLACVAYVALEWTEHGKPSWPPAVDPLKEPGSLDARCPRHAPAERPPESHRFASRSRRSPP